MGVVDLTQELTPAIEDVANLAKYLNGQTWSRHITLPRALHSGCINDILAPSDFTPVLQSLHDMLLRFCEYGALPFAVACCLARPTPTRPGQRPFERPWIRCPHCCTLTRTFSLKITILNSGDGAQVEQGQVAGVSLSTFATSIKVPEILIRDAVFPLCPQPYVLIPYKYVLLRLHRTARR